MVAQGSEPSVRIAAGGGRLPERAVNVGAGRHLFPDIIAEAADGGRVFINVGQLNARGQPVAREVKTLAGLERTGVPTFIVEFVKGTRRGIRAAIYRDLCDC